MKFGQLIEFDMRNIFLENHFKNVWEKLFPDSFLKNQNQAYLWINSLKLYTVFFIVCQVQDYQNILKLSCRPLFKKTKIGPELVSLPYLSMIFEENYLSRNILLPPDFIVWLPLLHEILGNICIVIVC